MTVTFLHISRKPNRRPRTWLYLYIVCKEIFSIFHAWIEYISVQNTQFKPMGPNPPKPSLPHIIPECLSRPNSPPKTRDRSIHALLHNQASKSPLVTMGCPTFTPKTAPYRSTSPLPSNTPIPRPIPLNSPNGIRMQSALLPQYSFQIDQQADTDKQTSRWDRRKFYSKSAYALLYW